MKDKFKALWVSHSSIGNFIECPRAYYLKNIYKNPKTGRKVQIVTPALALGQAVHAVLEPLANLNPQKRFENNLQTQFLKIWTTVTGKKGGFKTLEQEEEYKQRGLKMIENVINNKQLLLSNTFKLTEDLPWYWLNEDQEIILCGKVDWINYDEATDSVSIIDFKTSKTEEKEDSLQLPIYSLLLKNTVGKPASKAFYWYLESGNELTEKPLPNVADSYTKVLEQAILIKQAKVANNFKCKFEGCYSCRPYEKILNNQAEFVGVGEFNREIYCLL